MTKPPKARRKLATGKLPISILKRLLEKYTHTSRSVIVGPAVGIDTTVIDFHGRLLLAKTDPITFVADEIGTYAIHVNANDIAVMGGVPRWFLATVLLPESKATPRTVERIFRDLSLACKSIGVALVGGHTEVTPYVNEPIVVGQMLGEAKKNRLVTAAGVRAGDRILLTKGIAIEATSIIARIKGDELVKSGAFSRSLITRCRRFLKRPGLSVLKDAETALSSGRVHAMHDPTEGGLSSGLHELALASKRTLLIESESIPVFEETRRLCSYFGLDPMGSIASGALLLSIDPRDTKRVLNGFKMAGIKAAVIGTAKGKRAGVRVLDGSRERPLKFFERDEITRIL